jgi:hypothetical protein
MIPQKQLHGKVIVIGLPNLFGSDWSDYLDSSPARVLLCSPCQPAAIFQRTNWGESYLERSHYWWYTLAVQGR